MNWDILKGNWSQFKGEIRTKWGALTDDELDQVKGERDKLVGLLQEHYGLAKSDAEAELDRFVKEMKSAA
jgi:uncharacterized protein YjbJ (UPF0337 family)